MTELLDKRQAQLSHKQPVTQRHRGRTSNKTEKAVNITTNVTNPPNKAYEPLPEIKEACMSCGGLLKYIPINSRLKAVACTKTSCALYRQRIRIVVEKEVKAAECV